MPLAEGSDNELAYKGELSLMHYSTSEESEGNGGSDGFRSVIAEWEKGHSDITIKEFKHLPMMTTKPRLQHRQQQMTFQMFSFSGNEYKGMGRTGSYSGYDRYY